MSGILQLMLAGGGVVYDAASEAFFTACTTQPSTAAKTAINTLVLGLKADAIWDELDVFWPMALETEQAGRLELKNPGTRTLTAVNTPAFTAKFGWAGNGSTSYLDTGWDAATNGVQFTQNDAAFGCWLDAGTTTASGAVAMGGIAPSGAGSYFNPRLASPVANALQARINGGNASNFGSVLTRLGLTGCERTAASGGTATAVYRDGTRLAYANEASAALDNNDFYLGALNFNGAGSSYSDNRISCAFIGGALGDTKQAALYTRLNTFRTAMAAIP